MPPRAAAGGDAQHGGPGNFILTAVVRRAGESKPHCGAARSEPPFLARCGRRDGLRAPMRRCRWGRSFRADRARPAPALSSRPVTRSCVTVNAPRTHVLTYIHTLACGRHLPQLCPGRGALVGGPVHRPPPAGRGPGSSGIPSRASHQQPSSKGRGPGYGRACRVSKAALSRWRVFIRRAPEPLRARAGC